MFDIQTKIEFKKGNPSAFKEVFCLLYPRLKEYCKLFIRDKSQIEDIIQEIFITLWVKRDSILPEKSIESLIFVMIRNRCLNYLKKQKLEAGEININNLKVNELQYLYQLDFIKKEEKSLEESLIELMQKTVNELPDKMKKIFIQCKIEGKKQQVVADELGISLKMVEKHISKAKNKIRQKLITHYPALVVLIAILIE